MALFALMASLGEPAAQPSTAKNDNSLKPFDFTGEFDVNPFAKNKDKDFTSEFDADPFAKEETGFKMAHGGSVDELLEILRRK
jgi:hypothetical protein